VRARSCGCVALLATLCLAISFPHVAQADTKKNTRPAVKAPVDKAFQKTKKEFQLRSRQKKPADRIAALQLLEDFPTGEAAELVFVTLLDDKNDDVRQAAIGFLEGLRDRPEVTDKLLQRMGSAARKDGLDIRTAGALKAIAGTEDETLQNVILEFLNEFLGTPLGNLEALHAMIDAEAPRGDPEEVLRMLDLFTRANHFTENFGYRRCLVQGLMQVKDQEAITHLINLLPNVKGLVQFDVVSHLVAATGQNFGDDAQKWKTWWVAKRGQKDLDDKPPPRPVGNYGNFGEYYGIPICAKRVVFVLDTSLSMRGARIDAAKTELVRAIKELPKEVFFDVIAFDNTVRVWQPELVPATDPLKRVAVNVVLDQTLKFNTASFDALEAAFTLYPEAIYFLSDGAPYGGKIDNPREIIATISGMNRVRRVSIHSIGIDTGDAKTSIFGRFMKDLAEANWGVFKPVN
jgi:uncharacterized protein YegL